MNFIKFKYYSFITWFMEYIYPGEGMNDEQWNFYCKMCKKYLYYKEQL